MSTMKELVEYFVDGTDVDFQQMLQLGLIYQNKNEYSLTEFGKSFLRNINA